MKDPSRSKFVASVTAQLLLGKAANDIPMHRNKTGGQPRHAVAHGTSNGLLSAPAFAA